MNPPTSMSGEPNIATEELVHLLSLLGVETAVDLDALIDIARTRVTGVVGHALETSFEKADPSWRLHTAPQRQVLQRPNGGLTEVNHG